MEKYFANYNQSLALKELGYDEPCIMYIDDEGDLINDDTAEWIRAVKCPLKSQVFEWARDEYGLYHIVHHFEHNKNTANEFLSEVTGKLLMGNDDISGFSYHSTYKEAELACIDKLIEIIKTK